MMDFQEVKEKEQKKCLKTERTLIRLLKTLIGDMKMERGEKKNLFLKRGVLKRF